MATFAYRSKNLFSIVVDVDPVDIHSGGHDVADAAIANIESPLHHLLLRLLQETPLLTRSDQKLQLFRRVQRIPRRCRYADRRAAAQDCPDR